MLNIKQKWIKEYNHLYDDDGAWIISENNRFRTPIIAIIPEPVGMKSLKQAQNARLIEIAPELLEIVKTLIKISKNPSLDHPYSLNDIIDKANSLINRIKTT